MESHTGISLEFLWKHIGNLSIHFGILVENFWNLVGIFGYIGDMRTATHLEKLWKLDGNYIRKFLGIRLEFNFGTVLQFLRKHNRNSFEIFWNRIKPFRMILGTVCYSFG